jgi:hypothetical protein
VVVAQSWQATSAEIRSQEIADSYTKNANIPFLPYAVCSRQDTLNQGFGTLALH